MICWLEYKVYVLPVFTIELDVIHQLFVFFVIVSIRALILSSD